MQKLSISIDQAAVESTITILQPEENLEEANLCSEIDLLVNDFRLLKNDKKLANEKLYNKTLRLCKSCIFSNSLEELHHYIVKDIRKICVATYPVTEALREVRRRISENNRLISSGQLEIFTDSLLVMQINIEKYLRLKCARYDYKPALEHLNLILSPLLAQAQKKLVYLNNFVELDKLRLNIKEKLERIKLGAAVNRREEAGKLIPKVNCLTAMFINCKALIDHDLFSDAELFNIGLLLDKTFYVIYEIRELSNGRSLPHSVKLYNEEKESKAEVLRTEDSSSLTVINSNLEEQREKQKKDLCQSSMVT